MNKFRCLFSIFLFSCIGVSASMFENFNYKLNVTDYAAFEINSNKLLEKSLLTSNQIQQKTPSHFINHKVQRKETLYFISRKYSISVDDIHAYNPGLTNLKKGHVLRIPQWQKSEPGTTTSDADKKLVTPEKEKNVKIHDVKPGETFYSISRIYGQTVGSIIDLNPEVQILKPGMKIKIPVGEEVAAATKPVENTEKVQKYFTHTIAAGETLYAISRKYNIPVSTIIELNPELVNGYRSGTIIRLPVADDGKVSEADAKNALKHTVLKGETLFGLSDLYKVEITEIIRNNPFLESRSIAVGDVLVIRRDISGYPNNVAKTGDAEYIEKSKIACMPGLYYNAKKFKIVMLLPLMLDTNSALSGGNTVVNSGDGKNNTDETASTEENAGEKTGVKFQGNSENYIHFYEGALLAIDSLQQMGIKIDLEVYDTEQRSAKIRNLISSNKLEGADLIIGPVYQSELKDVAEFAQINHIPIVSPLSASDEISRNNPWFFQVNPSREYISSKTADYVLSAYSNANIIILSSHNSDNALEDELISKSGNIRRTETSKLDEVLDSKLKNVIVLSSKSEAEVSLVAARVNNLSATYDIVLIGTNRFPQFESISQEYFHNGQLEYLTPYWPDYKSKLTRSFVRNFRYYFKSDPNQFSIQGFDVTFFFIKALGDYGNDFRNCITWADTDLLQGKYSFQRIPSGGFINRGLNVVAYTRGFQITRKTIFGSNQ